MRINENEMTTSVFDALAKELYSSYHQKVGGDTSHHTSVRSSKFGYWCVVSHQRPNTSIRIEFETEQVIVLIRQDTLTRVYRDIRFYQYESPTLVEDLLCELLMIPTEKGEGSLGGGQVEIS